MNSRSYTAPIDAIQPRRTRSSFDGVPLPLADEIDDSKGSLPLVMHVRVVSGHGGGPEKTIFNSPRFLVQLGYRSVCLYLRDPADEAFTVLAARAAEKGAPLESVDDFGISDWRIVDRVMEQIRVYQPAIWHGHDYKSNLLGLLINRRLSSASSRDALCPPMRLVTTVHGWVQKTWKTPLYYFVDRRCLPRYRCVICVSQDLYDDCLKLGVSPESLRLVDNAIALDEYDLFDVDCDSARRRLGVPTDSPLIVAVGRLSFEKGFDLLIEAVGELIERGQAVTLAIAGDGPARSALEAQIDRSGHGDRIRLLGFVSDPRLVYRAATVYALSSRREGLPNSVLEAMAMGVPVAATAVAGMPKLVEHEVNGLLIEPDNSARLSEAIRRLLDDASLRSRLSRAARETVEERFSFRKRMDTIAEIYRDCLRDTER